MSVVKTRQKFSKKRSLHGVNENIEPIFNEGLASVIAFLQPAKGIVYALAIQSM